MKNFKTYFLIGLLSLSFTTTEILAQSIDANRMNRDIKIMENILGELFKTQTITNSNQTFVVSGSGLFNSNSNIRGTYLPGFGLIFKIEGANSRGIQLVSDSGSGSYSFYYNSENKTEDRNVDEASVKSRIKEFLKDYASTIGQLNQNEKVMVIYGSKSTSNLRFAQVVTRGGDDKSDNKELPVISVSAKASDLKDYRTGKLSESKLEEKLAIATSKDKEYLDLKVMSNIFETALQEQKGEAFRLSGGINHLMLDNFGALFSFDVRFSSGSRGNTIWDLYDVRTPRMHGQGTAVVGSETSTSDNKLEKEDLNKKIEAAYSTFLSNLKEYVIDYGRTLNSLDNDQFLLLSITVNGRYNNLPEKIDVQVKKSVLEQVDRGSLSREKALQQVIVTEY